MPGTVKIQKADFETGEIPPLCMLCGEKDAETKVPYTARKIGFPLAMMGIIGKFLTPKKYDMTVLSCSECKNGFVYEQNMSNIWLTLRLVAVLVFVFVLTAHSDKAPANLIIPLLVLFITVLLETVYFWAIGKKNAVRLENMDDNSVSLTLPNESWPAAYADMRLKREAERKRQRAGLA